MKQLRVSVVFALIFLAVGTSQVWAEENPLDFKQSKNAWVVWTDAVGAESVIFASKWEKKKWGEPMKVASNLSMKNKGEW